MILYFTGTGNSRYVAMRLSEYLRDEVISINTYFKYEKKALFHSEKPYVFVMPTYAWRMPKVVTTWIERACFTGNKNVYVILTCGSSIGQADKYARNFFRYKTKLCFKGLQYIIMPENYIVMFEAPKAKEAKEIISQSQTKIAQLARTIAHQDQFEPVSYHIGSIVESSLVNLSFYRFMVKDKGFYATDKCVSCQRCQQLCPLNNVSIVNGKPRWNGQCTHCMACICGCPVEAIEYKNYTQNKTRYFLPNEYEYTK